PTVFLCLVAIGVDIGRDDVGVQWKTQAASPRARDFFNQHGGMTKIAATAIGFGQHRVQQTFASSLSPHFLRHDAIALPLGMKRRNFLFKKMMNRITELLMVFTEHRALDQILHRASQMEFQIKMTADTQPSGASIYDF